MRGLWRCWSQGRNGSAARVAARYTSDGQSWYVTCATSAGWSPSSLARIAPTRPSGTSPSRHTYHWNIQISLSKCHGSFHIRSMTNFTNLFCLFIFSNAYYKLLTFINRLIFVYVTNLLMLKAGVCHPSDLFLLNCLVEI